MQRQAGRATLALATVGLAASGCAGIGGGITYQPPSDPESELRSAFEQLATETVKMDFSMGELLTMSGEMDTPNGAGHVSMSIREQGVELVAEIIVIDTEMWLNLGDVGAMAGLETPWMYVDVADFGDQGFMGMKPEEMFGTDPDAMLQGVGGVRKVDDRTFEGDMDLTQASTFPMGPGPDVDEFQQVAFAATVDDEGRIATMSVTLPDVAPGMPEAMEIHYYDYGVPVEVRPPPADQVSPMPPELYGMFET